MPEELGFVFFFAFWAVFVFAAFQRVWTVRRLRNRVHRLELEKARSAVSTVPVPALASPVEQSDLRRIQERLQVLERIAVEKENTLSREIEELRVAGR